MRLSWASPTGAREIRVTSQVLSIIIRVAPSLLSRRIVDQIGEAAVDARILGPLRRIEAGWEPGLQLRCRQAGDAGIALGFAGAVLSILDYPPGIEVKGCRVGESPNSSWVDQSADGSSVVLLIHADVLRTASP